MITIGFIIGVTIILMFVGMIWYSALFGNAWMHIMGMGHLSKEECKKMAENMKYAYIVQALASALFVWFFMSLFKVVDVLRASNADLASLNNYHVAILVWLGIIVPMNISQIIWGNTKKEVQLKQSLIVIGNNLVNTLIVTLVYSFWF